MDEIQDSFAIFVMATYGEGDPTDNAREFFDWLEDDREGLECLKYAVSVVTLVKSFMVVC